VIGEMPGVRTVRITAIPDAVRENDVAAEVDGDVIAADVKTWCDDRLAVYKRPSVVAVSGA